MIKQIGLVAFGYAIREPKTRKMMWTVTKNVTKNMVSDVSSLSGIKFDKYINSFKDLTKEENGENISVRESEVIENAQN